MILNVVVVQDEWQFELFRGSWFLSFELKCCLFVVLFGHGVDNSRIHRKVDEHELVKQ